MVIKRIGAATVVVVLGLAVAGTVPARAAVPSSVAHWSIVSSPNVWGGKGAGPQDNTLDGVSCSTATFCMAVGGVTSPVTAVESPLSEEWNGSTVRVVSTPNPLAGGQGDVELDSVSCTSQSFCMAVGWSNSLTEGLQALIERWNGATWSMTTPVGIVMTAVSCVSTTFCFAIGESGSGDAVTMKWHGMTWTQVPNPTPAEDILSGIQCTSISFCMVVGSVTEQWNGSGWSLDASSRNAPDSFVACPTSTFCMGVAGLASIERWNGSVWSVSTRGTPSQDVGAISCLTATSCTAVGSVEIYNGIYRTFIEHWDGATWQVMASPNAPRNNGGLLGVQCTSATFCMAVGWHDSSTTQDTLVEKY